MVIIKIVAVQVADEIQQESGGKELEPCEGNEGAETRLRIYRSRYQRQQYSRQPYTVKESSMEENSFQMIQEVCIIKNKATVLALCYMVC